MALNKFMHPRNIYKKPPDFAKLAREDAEFSKIVKLDVTGKVTIDFKDVSALRILTKCLLKHDFNVLVNIPENRLVPTLPLRLNYILWIEDLLAAIGKNESICGIDIGTGACAIYPLIAAVKNKWKMIATETDDESFRAALDNIQNNNLKDLINVKQVTTDSIIDQLLTNESLQIFSFCMCNPPFYSNIEELYESRSPARPQPKNGFSGSLQELVTVGGELEFCRKLIKESLQHKDRILVFTTMIGHKHNMKELLLDLKDKGIKYTETEFCQGRVTRWGLAWTFQDLDLYKLVPPREKPRKRKTSIVNLLPKLPNIPHDIENTINKLKELLENLNIIYKVISKRGNFIVMDVSAKENTWSNQRKRKRLIKKLENDGESKKLKLCNSDIISAVVKNNNIDSVESIEENTNISDNATKVTDSSDKNDCLVHAFLKVHKKESVIMFEMEFIDGSGGKESLHQIVQYIKNNWK